MPSRATCILALGAFIAAGCARGSPPPGEPRPSPAMPPPPEVATTTPAPQPNSPNTNCLAGVWTQKPPPDARPLPSACGNCPDTTYELSAEGDTFRVREAGIVQRSGHAKSTGDELVFEMTNDQGAVAARFSCRPIEACHRLKCAWSAGGAGESVLVK